LDAGKLANIPHIITDQDKETPYTKSKERLIGVYGLTDKQKLDQLMKGIKCPTNTKPSLVLQEVRQLSAGLKGSEILVRQAWLNMLPLNIQMILVADEASPVDLLAKIADKMFDLQEKSTKVAAIQTMSMNRQQLAENQVLTTVCAALSSLTKQIVGIQEKMRDREYRP